MLNQAFSADNFRKILDIENRRGVYLEKRYFTEAALIGEEIKRATAEIRAKRKELGNPEFLEYRKIKNEEIKLLREKKDQILNIELEKVSNKVTDEKFQVNLSLKQIKGKPAYTVNDIPETYFAIKQIQYNFRKLYKVKQANRNNIICQIRELLSDGFPKIIIKTDIESFYESIEHKKLLNKINSDNLLSYNSKKIIWKILNDYKSKSGISKGVPRGIGISAYLSELFMRDIDKEIKSINNIIYYARYVDDIVAIFSPTVKDGAIILDKIKNIIEAGNGLKINEKKTKMYVIDCEAPKKQMFNYLGYQITFGTGHPTKLEITESKYNKYKNRIDLTFNAYQHYSKVNEKKARKLLVKRIRFMTSNTRLYNNKKNVLVGIYFTNSLITDCSALIKIDKYLLSKINTLNNPSLEIRLKKNSFHKGFIDREFKRFSTVDLSKIISVWKYAL